MGRLGGVLVGVVLATTSLLALGSGPAGPTTFLATPLLPPPSSMAALGDSFTVGYATGGSCTAVCPENSWSTGTAVDSHYQRLVALNPSLTGNATNSAAPGATMSLFAGQVATVVASHPEYVTVLLGAGDICFTTNPPATFATQFRAGMDALFAGSPNTRVLVSSIESFESVRAAVLDGGNPSPWAVAGPSSLCNVFFRGTDPQRAALMTRIVAYNTALATECATYANCLFDGNALFNHAWTLPEVSSYDNLHPSVVGQNMISDVLYRAGYRWGTEPAAAPAVTRAPDFTG